MKQKNLFLPVTLLCLAISGNLKSRALFWTDAPWRLCNYCFVRR